MTIAERTATALRRRTVLAMAVGGIGAIGCAGAARPQSVADLVELTVVDRETGQPLQVWRRDGRLFVAGQPDARYSLRVTNHTGGRVLVVMSVDGVNILTGETAGYGQTGYVFGPYETYDVTGWRKSNTEVAAFNFASLSQSYAARTGRPADVGVIGIAAFRERVVPPAPVAPLSEFRRDRRSDPNSEVSELVVTGQRAAPAPAPPIARRAPAPPIPPAAAAQPSEVVVNAQRREEKLGTAHGAREWSVVTNVPFDRATSYPQLVRRIEYDTYDNLVAMGVIRPQLGGGRRPRAFPSNPDGPGYVPDPPGGR